MRRIIAKAALDGFIHALLLMLLIEATSSPWALDVSVEGCLLAALGAGLLLSALHNGMGAALHLPRWCGSLALLGGGMFVGMLASALGEILEVAPVLMRRFRLGDVSTGVRWVMMLAKGLGALLACLAFTL